MARVDDPYHDPHAGGHPIPGPPRVDTFPPGTVDLTFAVHKSVSVYFAALRAAKRYADAEKVIDTHQHGVRAALSYLNRKGAWARNTGDRQSTDQQLAAALAAEPHAEPERREQLRWQFRSQRYAPGARYDASTGLFTLQITHVASEHSSRCKDGGEHPHIHTHVFVLPSVISTDNGQLHPLDTPTLERETWTAAALHNRTANEALMQTLPVRFEQRQGHQDRVMVGVPDDWIAVYPHARCSISVAQQLMATTPAELCHWLGDQHPDDAEDAQQLIPRR